MPRLSKRKRQTQDAILERKQRQRQTQARYRARLQEKRLADRRGEV